jgi:hypothetical protein
VLDGGGCVTADGVPVPRGGLGAEAAGDLLLGLRGPQVAFGLVGGGRNPQVGQEPQDLGLAVVQAFQEESAGFLPCLRAGTRRTCCRPARTAWRKSLRSVAVSSAGAAARPLVRASFAAWMRARSASAAWPGQMAPG